MKYYFVINPAAGKGKNTEGLSEKIKSVCEKAKVDFEIYRTKARGDAIDFVKRVIGGNLGRELRFIACGGDGTLGEVANGIMGSEDSESCSLGVIPSGTGNDFVRNFTNKELFSDIDSQLDASPMPVDLIDCNGYYAVNMVNIGFDCEVVCKKEELQTRKLFPSKLSYIGGLVTTLIRKPGVKCKISFDGEAAEDYDLLLTTYANGEFCGGGFHSNPNSRISNGLINALTVNQISRLKFLSIVGSYKKGTHLVHTDILSEKTAKTVKFLFDGDTNVCIDGEVVKVKELTLSIAKSAVKFLVPRGCEYAHKSLTEAVTV
jgi:YegS/Rv2252/BmrU family lipid kinase